MRKSILSLIISVFMFFTAVSGIVAQNAPGAMIRDMAGTVELKQPGSTVWQAAVRGQALTGDTTISTGFKSTAIIVLGDSLLTVQPLTRLTIEQLSRSANNDRIELNLRAGKVRVEVKAQTGYKTDFTVRSTSAVASVRGTTFEFDTLNIVVSEGTVTFAGASGAPVFVDGGGRSYADEHSGQATSREETYMAELKPDLPTASEPVAERILAKPSSSSTRMIITISL